MLEACPRGRAVVNDLDGVIDVARRKSTEHDVADRCEFRPGDFHTIRLEDGAYDIVVLGHVCRTEGPGGARHLVERAYSALRPEGRVVVADYFIGPNHKTNPHAVLMGMTMMASTVNGFGVTTETATGWLTEAGFEAIHLIEPIGFQFRLRGLQAPKSSGRLRRVVDAGEVVLGAQPAVDQVLPVAGWHPELPSDFGPQWLADSGLSARQDRPAYVATVRRDDFIHIVSRADVFA